MIDLTLGAVDHGVAGVDMECGYKAIIRFGTWCPLRYILRTENSVGSLNYFLGSFSFFLIILLFICWL